MNFVKICSKCNIKKNASEFYTRSKSRDGLRSQCKNCEKNYFEQNKIERAKKQKIYDLAHKEERVEYLKKYRLSNKDKIASSNANYRSLHKKEHAVYGLEYRRLNKAEISARNKKYYELNKEKIYTRNKIKSQDPCVRARRAMRNSVNRVFYNTQFKKLYNTRLLIGIDIDKFISYIESMFLPGMTWGNRGKVWHIDHIIPCTYFDLTNKDQQLKCCNYTNLQPLYATTFIAIQNGESVDYIGNIEKGNKLIIGGRHGNAPVITGTNPHKVT